MTRESQDIRQVIQAECALAEAHRELDLETFDRLLHPEYAVIQPGGAVEDKEDTLASLQSGTRHWDIAGSDQFDVRIYGDAAVVISRWQGKGKNGDESFDYSARALAVWIRENGRWRNVAAMSTAQEEPKTP